MRSCFLDGADLAPDNVRGFCLLPMQMRVAHEFGAGHDVYFYFIASVILPLSKIWKLKSYLSYIARYRSLAQATRICIGSKQKPRTLSGAKSSPSKTNYAFKCAAFFFLRQPSRPNTLQKFV